MGGEVMPIKIWSFECSYRRYEDQLDLHYYFFNLVPKGMEKLSLPDVMQEIRNGSVPDTLVPHEPDQNSYMVIKLHPQHLAEELLVREDKEVHITPYLSDGSKVLNTFLSGHSFLSLKLFFPNQTKELPFTSDTLLDWSQHELLTIYDLENSINLPFQLKNSVTPEEKDPQGNNTHPIKDLNRIPVWNSDKIPLTILELPYKLFLSPRFPKQAQEPGHTNWRFVWDPNVNPREVGNNIFPVWYNQLQTELTNRKGTQILPPSFQVVGWAGAEQKAATEKTHLLPDAVSREKLARLSNIRDNIGNRDTNATQFMLTSLGATAKLKYFNKDTRNFEIREWQQEISLGRDQFIQITEVGLLYPSMSKALKIKIGERRIENGLSFMDYYTLIKPVETEKDYTAFFQPAQINTNGHSRNLPFKNLRILTDISPKFTEQESDWIKDGDSKLLLYPTHGGDNIPFEFSGTDHHGNIFPFSANVAFIPEGSGDQAWGWKKLCQMDSGAFLRFEKALLHDFVGSSRPKTDSLYDHRTFIDLKNQPVAYAFNEKIENGKKTINKITELETKRLQFTFALGAQFENDLPAIPQLKVALAELPGVNRLSGQVKPLAFRYADSYLNAGFDQIKNKAQVFLNHVEARIDDKITYQQAKYTELFQKNVREFGGLVNTDIAIQAISAADQSLFYYEGLNKDYQSLKSIRPRDLFTGKSAEILGGLSIVDILQEVIPETMTPVFKTVEDFDKKILIIREQLQQQFNDDRIEILHRISQYERELQEFLASVESTLIDHLFNLLSEVYDQIAEIRKVVEMYREKFQGMVVVELNQQSKKVDELIDLYLDLFVDVLEQAVLNAPGVNLSLEGVAVKYKTSTTPPLDQTVRNAINHLQNTSQLLEKELEVITKDVSEKTVLTLTRFIEGRSLENTLQELLFLKEEKLPILNQLNKALYRDLVSAWQKKQQAEALLSGLGMELDVWKKRLEQAAETERIQIQEEINQVNVKVQEISLNLKYEADVAYDLIRKQFEDDYNQIRQQLEQRLREEKLKFKTIEAELRGGIDNYLMRLNTELLKARNQLLNAYGEEAQKLRDKIIKLDQIIRWLRVPDSITNRYAWQVDSEAFSNYDSGFIKFYKKPNTTFSVEAVNTIELETATNIDLQKLQVRLELPKVKRVQFQTNSVLRNFNIRFFELISIDFNEIQFLAGTGRKSNLSVAIGNISFGGVLNFVSLFQEYLSTLGFPFEVIPGPRNIRINYGIRVPDFEGGGFTFKNAFFTFDFNIPFESGVPMSIRFCVASREEKFMLAVGYFAGAGYLCIELDAKNGVVGLEGVLEFGGYLGLRLGPVKGHVMLMVGIYYRMQKVNNRKREEFHGYLVCAGVLNIMGLISVYLVFYMALENRGSYLYGSCRITYGFRIGRFFKKTVTMGMTKKIKGTSNRNQQSFSSAGASTEYTNTSLLLESLTDEHTIEVPTPDQLTTDNWVNYIRTFKM